MTPGLLGGTARHATASLLRCQTDARLVELVRDGSEPAFEALVSRYERPLLRYCTRLLPDDRAQDAVQATFLNAFRALRDSSSDIDLRPWLYRIAHNASVTQLRDRAWGHSTIDENVDGVERPDQAFVRRQGMRDVLAAVAALPEHQRDAMILRELEGRSYEEISAQLGVTTGSVRQLLNRGRNTLRTGATAVTPPAFLGWPGAEASAAAPVARVAAQLLWGGGAKAAAVKAGLVVVAVGAVANGGPGDNVPTPASGSETRPGKSRAHEDRADVDAAPAKRTTAPGGTRKAADRRVGGPRDYGVITHFGPEPDREHAGQAPRHEGKAGHPGGGGRSEGGRSPSPDGKQSPADGDRGESSGEPEPSQAEAPGYPYDEEQAPSAPEAEPEPSQGEEPSPDPPALEEPGDLGGSEDEVVDGT